MFPTWVQFQVINHRLYGFGRWDDQYNRVFYASCRTVAESFQRYWGGDIIPVESEHLK
jgi:hypothetical protein